MKIKMNLGEFRRAARLAARVISGRNTIPVLDTARLIAYGGCAQMTVTDLDGEYTLTLDAEMIEEGAGLLRLKSILPALDMLAVAAEIEIEIGPDEDGFLTSRVAVTGDDFPFEWETSSFAVEDFPRMDPDGDFPPPFILSAAEIRDLLTRTKFAISPDLNRYYLHGIYLHLVDGRLTAVATTGRHLARYQLASTVLISGNDALDAGVIVPRDFVHHLLAMLPARGDNHGVAISLTATHIRVRTDEITLTGKLIDGTYPDYRAVIPDYSAVRPLTVARTPLRRMATMMRRIGRRSGATGAALRIEMDGPSIDVTARHDYSTVLTTSRLPAAYTGPAATLGVNAQYLAEILGEFRSDAVDLRFEIGEGEKRIAAPVTFASAEDPDFLAVLMPMRV